MSRRSSNTPSRSRILLRQTATSRLWASRPTPCRCSHSEQRRVISRLISSPRSLTATDRTRPLPWETSGGKTNKWAGQFRAHDGWLGVQSSNYDGEERLEFIAVSTATERRGSHVFDTELFEEHMDADEMIDIVNVLWIERIGEVAYRRGIGHILLKAWEAQAKEEVGVLLG
ncbi:hypothetical protein FALCPG4_001608 [Fusarium falciforme]